MADNKKRLQGMLGTQQPDQPQVQKGAPYSIVPPVREELVLPPQASELSAPLQEIARQYVGARRRSGEALLDAARWLSEARSLAEHGEWQIFLDATGTSDDAAERLLNIHKQAMQNPQFAEAITRNWLGQSTAALLARPSTPPEVIAEVLESETPPKVADIQQAIRKRRQRQVEVVENPQFADFEESQSQEVLQLHPDQKAVEQAVEQLSHWVNSWPYIREALLHAVPDLTIPTQLTAGLEELWKTIQAYHQTKS